MRGAPELPGVERIALVGSLATEKEYRNDVDLVVTVGDEMDLAPLATLGRRLRGRTQSLGLGCEVFLADRSGAYLGRICPWRRCGPGIRASCDAVHCGRRLYLHDDLETIRLPRELVGSPPIELWPEAVARVPVPDDVRAGHLEPLTG